MFGFQILMFVFVGSFCSKVHRSQLWTVMEMFLWISLWMRKLSPFFRITHWNRVKQVPILFYSRQYTQASQAKQKSRFFFPLISSWIYQYQLNVVPSFDWPQTASFLHMHCTTTNVRTYGEIMRSLLMVILRHKLSVSGWVLIICDYEMIFFLVIFWFIK